jgi:predicted  nucleic acid-binding Zn-ribbon protein
LSDFAGEITIEEYNAFTEEKNDLNMKIKSAQSDLTELRTILHKLDDEKFFRLSGKFL